MTVVAGVSYMGNSSSRNSPSRTDSAIWSNFLQLHPAATTALVANDPRLMITKAIVFIDAQRGADDLVVTICRGFSPDYLRASLRINEDYSLRYH
jgi:hypothetical protein